MSELNFKHQLCDQFTYNMRPDPSQLKQRGNKWMVDLSSFLFSSKWVDEHQQSMWTQRTWKMHVEYHRWELKTSDMQPIIFLVKVK